MTAPVFTEVVHSDDGTTRVVHLLRDGVLFNVSTSSSPASREALEAAAEQAAIDARRAILRQQLDPNQPDPTTKQLADAQAFVALAADIGVAETAAVAGAWA